MTPSSAHPLFPRAALHPAALALADSTLTQPWCVAFSGGADSLALLHTLLALYPKQRPLLHALHFNHRLRGPESDADAQFCRETCTTLGVPLHSTSWQTNSTPLPLPTHPSSPISESTARTARHAFFAETMTSLGARTLFTGHQLDDIAETQLMRLARGSSSTGLAAPRPVQLHRDGRTFLRPLLTLRKTEILSALRAASLTWREDASNTTTDYFRNRIRHVVLPALQATSPNDPLLGAALTRELLDEDSAALDTWLAQLLPASDPSPGNPRLQPGSETPPPPPSPTLPDLRLSTLDLRPLLNHPRALWRRALRRWPPATDLARTGFEQLLALALLGHGQLTTAHGLIHIQDHTLTLTPPTPSAPHPTQPLLQHSVITLTPAQRAHILTGQVNPLTTAYLATPYPTLHIRNPLPGDRYHPLGAPGSAKLSDLFINRKIPLALRATLPVVCSLDGRILWIPGFPPAHDEKLTDASTTVLQLTYQYGTSTFSPQST